MVYYSNLPTNKLPSRPICRQRRLSTSSIRNKTLTSIIDVLQICREAKCWWGCRTHALSMATLLVISRGLSRVEPLIQIVAYFKDGAPFFKLLLRAPLNFLHLCYISTCIGFVSNVLFCIAIIKFLVATWLLRFF